MAKFNKSNSNQRGNKNSHIKADYDRQQKRNGRSARENNDRGPRDVGPSRSKATNDISWYNKFPDLLQNAGSIPFSRPLGASLKTELPWKDAYSKWNPGIMSILLVSGIGAADNTDDAINTMVNKLYADIRKANNATAPYDPQDLFLYLEACANVYMFYQFVFRALCCVDKYASYQNTFMPDALLKSMGFDPDFVRLNRKDLYGLLDTWAIQLTALQMPDNLNVFKRKTWLYANVYADAPNVDKAQLYVFNPEGFYFYNEVGERYEGGYLEFKPWHSVYSTTVGNLLSDMGELRDYFNSLINPLLHSEDFYILRGDMMKFWPGPWMAVQGSSAVGTIAFQYDEVVLNQIHNLFAYHHHEGSNYNFTDFDIYQDPNTNTIKWTPTCFLVDEQKTQMIDLRLSDPTPGDVMEATRLMATAVKARPTYAPQYHDGNNSTIVSSGTEICTGLGVYYIWTNQITGEVSTHELWMYSEIKQTVEMPHWQDALVAFSMLEKFDWAPRIYYRENYTGLPVVAISGDTDNWTYITREDLDMLNRAAIFSLYDMS